MGRKFVFKVLLLGPSAVGKTSLLYRYAKNKFSLEYTLTIGVEFLTKEIKFKKDVTHLTIWDIGGQKRFKFLHKRFYNGTNGALLIFDLTRRETYGEMSEWVSEMYEILGEKIPFVLIGNKVDLIEDIGRLIDINKAKDLAESNESIYIETSAKTGENVEEAFAELTRRMAARKDQAIT